MTEPTEETVRAEVRAWLEANWSPDLGLVEWRGKLIDAGSVHPQLGAVYPLEEAPEAWRRAARGGLRGKLALRVRG